MSEFKCSQCGVGLERISFVQPLQPGDRVSLLAIEHRPPLCEPCWVKAVKPFSDRYLSDRYDAAHPESEHDGGLGSGDWMGPWEDRR